MLIDVIARGAKQSQGTFKEIASVVFDTLLNNNLHLLFTVV
jgi:hypothetical protein